MRCLFLACSFFLVSIQAFAEKPTARPPNNTIDSLQNCLKTAAEDTNKVKILYALTMKEIVPDPVAALNYGMAALKSAKQLNWRKGFFLAYSGLGSAYYTTSGFEPALQNIKMAIQFNDAEEDKKLVANNFTRAGNSLFYLGDYPKALEYFQLALNISRALGNKKLEAFNLNNMGGSYKELCDFPKSLETYLQALKINRDLGDKYKEAEAIGNIGNIYADMHDAPKALNYYQQALQMDKVTGNKMAEEANLGNIGALYEATGELNKALAYDQQAFNIAAQIEDKQGQSLTLGNIGGVYIQLSNFPKALEYLQEALKMNIALQDKNDEADNYVKIGEVYRSLGDYSKAIYFEENSLKLSKEMGALDIEQMAYKSLSDIYKNTNRPGKELDAYKMYVLLKDSIVNVDKQKEIMRKQMQFDFDMKEAAEKAEQDKKDILTRAEIQKDKLQRDSFIGGGVFLLLLSGLLFYGYRRNSKQNILLASQKTAIELRDREKELLLRELHHRVKNNLQIVSSLLSLQSNQMQDDISRQAFREGQSRVEAMALIHQRLYLGDKMSTIDIQDYLQNLVRSVSGSYGFSKDKFELVFDVEKMNLDVEIAIPLGLILNEVLSNCFKHAFKGITNPRLEIKLQKSSNTISLTIADNGTGIPDEVYSGKTKTFGMRMVNSLTKQIRGSLQILNRDGSVFEFHFPLDKNTMEITHG